MFSILNIWFYRKLSYEKKSMLTFPMQSYFFFNTNSIPRVYRRLSHSRGLLQTLLIPRDVQTQPCITWSWGWDGRNDSDFLLQNRARRLHLSFSRSEQLYIYNQANLQTFWVIVLDVSQMFLVKETAVFPLGVIHIHLCISFLCKQLDDEK